MLPLNLVSCSMQLTCRFSSLCSILRVIYLRTILSRYLICCCNLRAWYLNSAITTSFLTQIWLLMYHVSLWWGFLEFASYQLFSMKYIKNNLTCCAWASIVKITVLTPETLNTIILKLYLYFNFRSRKYNWLLSDIMLVIHY